MKQRLFIIRDLYYIIGGTLLSLVLAGIIIMTVPNKSNKETKPAYEPTTKIAQSNKIPAARSKCPGVHFVGPVTGSSLSCNYNKDFSKLVCVLCQPNQKCIIFDANNCR